MTKPTGGEVIEPYANPELLAPGTVRRPVWISEADWSRMPWPAQWRVARAEPARLAHVARVRELEARQATLTARRRLAAVLDELDQDVVIPTDPPDVTAARRAALEEAVSRRRRAS